MNWKKITVSTEKTGLTAEDIATILMNTGASGTVEEDSSVSTWIEQPREHEFLDLLVRTLSMAADRDQSEILAAITLDDEPDRDWSQWWKRDLTIVEVGRFRVVPSWMDYEPGPQDIVIHMDPGMAFGTALHPTTRLCMRAIENLPEPPARVLDMGTGSGILAIAVKLLHPSARVSGWDTDPLALEEAHLNCERNGVTMELVHPRDGETFDLVLANISPPVLKDMARHLEAWTAPGGRLVLSGIPGPQSNEVSAAFGLTPEYTLEEEGWRLLVYRKEDDL